MRKIYHLCWASHNEVMCRSEADLIRLYNSLSEVVFETESRLLADSEMTTHMHIIVACDDSKSFISRLRYKYSRYFNSKYGRTGKLGEKSFYVLELDGARHIQTALSYVFRQGLHHGLSSTPFGYAYNSVNCIFKNELGKEFEKQRIVDSLRYKYLSSHNKVDSIIRMGEDGSLFREDVIDIKFVEEIYVTPKNFLFQMMRKSGSDWETEQQEDKNGKEPVNLKMIEPNCFENDISKFVSNELGREDRSRMSDIELCELVDNDFVKRYSKENDASSIYCLPVRQRIEIANEIWRMSKKKIIKYANEEQIQRCVLFDR